MAQKNFLPRKHIAKSMTAKQEMIVGQIQQDLDLRTMLEAKHEYFENREQYDNKQGTKIVPIPGIALKKEEPKQKASSKPQAEEKQKRALLTISETKLGITMVLTKEDCKKLGFTGKELTKEAIKVVREKLGLPHKPMRGK